jgi:hypothetical protein
MDATPVADPEGLGHERNAPCLRVQGMVGEGGAGMKRANRQKRSFRKDLLPSSTLGPPALVAGRFVTRLASSGPCQRPVGAR